MNVKRYEVPIDGEWHDLELPAGPILHTHVSRIGFVQIWIVEMEADAIFPRRFRIFGTGDNIPPTAAHVGTTVSAVYGTAWHLFEDRR